MNFSIRLRALNQIVQQYPKIVMVMGVVALLLVLNSMILHDMTADVRNSGEASLLWPDEGRHVQMLERIQRTGSGQLLQKSYTALHINVSYAFSWLANSGERPIPPDAFIVGSRWAGWLSMMAFLLTITGMVTHIFGSVQWGLFALLVFIFQRFSIFYSTRLHPEAMMIFFIALAMWMAYCFLQSGKARYLYAMVAFSTFAIGTKPICLFLLPWMALVFVATLLKHKKFTPIRVLHWGTICCGVLALSFFVASPYQFLNFSEWVSGVLSERRVAENLEKDRSLWLWIEVFFSDAFLGPVLAIVFFLALGYGVYHIWQAWQQKHSEATSPLALFFMLNGSWILVGAGYILLTSHSFIQRYLIHVHFSLLMIILIALKWGMKQLLPKHNKWVIPLLILVFWGGLQIQWRRAMRGNDTRAKIVSQLPIHRTFFEQMKKTITQDSQIVYGKHVYLGDQYFSNIHRIINRNDLIGGTLDRTWVENHDFDFLILRAEQHGKSLLVEQGMDQHLEYVSHDSTIRVGVYRKRD